MSANFQQVQIFISANYHVFFLFLLNCLHNVVIHVSGNELILICSRYLVYCPATVFVSSQFPQRLGVIHFFSEYWPKIRQSLFVEKKRRAKI